MLTPTLVIQHQCERKNSVNIQYRQNNEGPLRNNRETNGGKTDENQFQSGMNGLIIRYRENILGSFSKNLDEMDE
ncbi:hypothetical protein J6590_078443 [Homalodisca vitripennis]|nr:hypothetical protein J6590_078443 [Homalodisca vitripennis]